MLLTPSSAVTNARRHLTSRYASTAEVERAKKKVRIELNSFSNDGPVEIIDREKSTAKSFRSAIQLDN